MPYIQQESSVNNNLRLSKNEGYILPLEVDFNRKLHV
jgi:hypothetical protein